MMAVKGTFGDDLGIRDLGVVKRPVSRKVWMKWPAGRARIQNDGLDLLVKFAGPRGNGKCTFVFLGLFDRTWRIQGRSGDLMLDFSFFGYDDYMFFLSRIISPIWRDSS